MGAQGDPLALPGRGHHNYMNMIHTWLFEEYVRYRLQRCQLGLTEVEFRQVLDGGWDVPEGQVGGINISETD